MAEVQTVAPNPFALMMTPDTVLQAVERSERLGSLQRRICRPLDKPLIPKKGEGAELDAFDSEIDSTVIEEEPASEA